MICKCLRWAFMLATIAIQNLGGISWSCDTKNKCYILFGVCWLSLISTFRNNVCIVF